jgi:hypothetical protein
MSRSNHGNAPHLSIDIATNILEYGFSHFSTTKRERSVHVAGGRPRDISFSSLSRGLLPPRGGSLDHWDFASGEKAFEARPLSMLTSDGSPRHTGLADPVGSTGHTVEVKCHGTLEPKSSLPLTVSGRTNSHCPVPLPLSIALQLSQGKKTQGIFEVRSLRLLDSFFAALRSFSLALTSRMTFK